MRSARYLMCDGCDNVAPIAQSRSHVPPPEGWVRLCVTFWQRKRTVQRWMYACSPMCAARAVEVLVDV